MSIETKYRICPLCEATCGLAIDVDGRKVTHIRGDADDAFSEGYICPKGVALQDLDADPDRLRTPMIREGATWREATYDEAFALIDARLMPIIKEHGRNAVGVYLGNPSVHNTGLAIYAQAFLRALNTQNVFSAGTVDQVPKQLSSALMFGTGLTIPIPDLDRTDYLVIVGANPIVSNGSLMTAPNVGERLKRIRKRGGKIVVVDPRHTETAKAADEHLFIRPGTDAYFLFAVVNVLFAEDLVRLGALDDVTNGLDEVRELSAPFTPEAVAEVCGIDAATTRRIAREIAAAPSATVYSRIGASTQEFGTLANWLPDVIHVLTGNLDRRGGAMFPLPAHGPGNTKGTPGRGKGLRVARHRSRVRGLAELFGELPCACLAEEIETPGDGQIRAFFTVAGNPVLSTPNGARLDAALDSLDFMVSLDIYLNETSRHADVILPGLSPLEGCHYDMAFAQLAIQDHARFSPAMFPKPAGMLAEWETVLRLVGILSGQGPNADIRALDDFFALTMIQRETGSEHTNIHGRDAQDILAALAPRRGPERLIDLMLRTGPYGDGFGAKPGGLTLAALEAKPHGVDLGPLKPRMPEVLRTSTGMIELAPEPIAADVARLRDGMAARRDGFVLIGRRHLRSNNSWMHNAPRLVTGKPRCTAQINARDAARLGVVVGGLVTVASRTGAVTLPAEVSEDIMPGVISIPHGWGHTLPGTRMSTAQAHAGVNSNLLADETLLDVPSGNAVLCGIPVTVEKAEAGEIQERERMAMAK